MYVFIKKPDRYESSEDLVKDAISNNLLIIPGNVFSEQDTHFRISFAATDETLVKGAEILNKLARGWSSIENDD